MEIMHEVILVCLNKTSVVWIEIIKVLYVTISVYMNMGKS